MKKKIHFMAAVLCAFLGCVGTEKPAVPLSAGTGADASCNECHPFPGSLVCKSDTVFASGKPNTQCFACHLGAIAFTGSYDSLTNTMLYHDVMSGENGGRFPVTDSLHGSRPVDPVFGQCTFCHGYPPETGSHSRHVRIEGKKCYECHFASVASDTVVQTDPGSGGMFTFYTQRGHATPLDSLFLPFMKRESHIDHSVQVSFRKKFQLPRVPDSAFAWTRESSCCSNIECHSGTAFGGASAEYSLWK